MVYATEEVVLEAMKDARIIETNLNPPWSMVWTFDGRPRRPLWDLLDGLGIEMQDAVTAVPIARPGG